MPIEEFGKCEFGEICNFKYVNDTCVARGYRGNHKQTDCILYNLLKDVQDLKNRIK